MRDETIILVSFYAGLRAKEIAALTVGNIFDEDGAIRTQFILSAQQSKGGQTRTVYLNQRLRKALREYGDYIRLADPQRPLFASQKGGHFSANTMCQFPLGKMPITPRLANSSIPQLISFSPVKKHSQSSS